VPADSADAALHTNAYAIAYRLLGDRPAAQAVAGIATQRLVHVGGMTRPDWMYLLIEFTLDQTLGPGALVMRPDPGDPFASLRGALRRRLERATRDERVAACLIHLAGYPVDWSDTVLGTDTARAAALAGVLAPPPGVDYRDLGDPEITGRRTTTRTTRRWRRPHWTTVAAAVLVSALILAATQITGPRPTLGPPLDEGAVQREGPAQVQRNGGPLNHATSE
jgi:hypothetical protein